MKSKERVLTAIALEEPDRVPINYMGNPDIERRLMEDTVSCCRDTLDVMMPGGGYLFAPTHRIQDNTPTKNVVAMYDTAKTYGAY